MSEVILLIAAILALGFIALEIFKRTKVSQVIILILLGMVLGPLLNVVDAGPGSLIRDLTPFVSTIALIFLLFDAGLTLDLRTVIEEFGKASLFTLLVFFVSSFVIALFSLAFLGLPFLFALLLGFICGGVSSAIVLAMVENAGLGENVKTMLSLESTFTDILVVIFSLLVFNTIMASQVSDPLNMILVTISVSLITALIAYATWLVIFTRVETHNLSYILTVAVMLFLYAIAERAGGNGGFSVFVFGLLLGNFSILEKYFLFLGGLKGEIYKLLVSEIKRFDAEIAFFIRTFLFVLTGLLISFEGITVTVFLFAILITLIIALIRYPIFKYLYKDESEWEARFVSAMVPRGLAAIVVVTILPELVKAGQKALIAPYIGTIEIVTILVVLFSNILASGGTFLLYKEKSAIEEIEESAKA
ncbi:MAG: hypothetical protein D6769_01680 [Methanobacteriota archaeon]|nr:MAG: hypothetical protein D6769_01680 [Euryarchaeota archaeon]